MKSQLSNFSFQIQIFHCQNIDSPKNHSERGFIYTVKCVLQTTLLRICISREDYVVSMSTLAYINEAS